MDDENYAIHIHLLSKSMHFNRKRWVNTVHSHFYTMKPKRLIWYMQAHQIFVLFQLPIERENFKQTSNNFIMDCTHLESSSLSLKISVK